VQSLLLAETAVLVQLESVGVVLLVLHGVVVALLALTASEGNSDSHLSNPSFPGEHVHIGVYRVSDKI
jgi:hypothetical protein